MKKINPKYKYSFILWDTKNNNSLDEAISSKEFIVLMDYISINKDYKKASEAFDLLSKHLPSTKEISLVEWLRIQNKG